MALIYPNPKVFSEVSEYLRKLSQGCEGSLIHSEVTEEVAEDVPIASERVEMLTSGGIVKIKYSEVKTLETRFRYFIDGVVETRPIAKIQIKGIEIPVHLVTCGAGVFERMSDSLVRPTNNVVILTFLALPYSAIADLDSSFRERYRPQGLRLNDLRPLSINYLLGVELRSTMPLPGYGSTQL